MDSCHIQSICLYAYMQIFEHMIYDHPCCPFPKHSDHRPRVAKATEQKAKIESHPVFLDSAEDDLTSFGAEGCCDIYIYITIYVLI